MDISRFCGEIRGQELLKAPFNIGELTIATNGYMLIATARREEYSEYTAGIAGHIFKTAQQKEGEYKTIPSDTSFPE